MNKNTLEVKIKFFLNSYFTFQEYHLSPEDKKKIDRDKVGFILSKLTRKKYRKRKLVDKTRKAIEEKIKLSIKENWPIHLVVPFGGYKHFWNSSHPEPDWAELFNFKFLSDYVAPILLTYKPGAIVEYVSEDLILPKMNNYPEKTLEQYSKTFKKILTWYNKKLPNNLQFKFFRVKDKCDHKKLIKKVNGLIEKRKKDFSKLTQKEKDRELHRSHRSIMWQGKEDWSKLSEKQKKNKIIESRIIELAYYDTEAEKEFLGEYLWEKNHICIVFSFGTTHDNDEFQDITLGSTYASVVDHWIGRGILEKRENHFIPNIISKNQYQKMKKNLTQVKVQGFNQGKNYKAIEVKE